MENCFFAHFVQGSLGDLAGQSGWWGRMIAVQIRIFPGIGELRPQLID